MAIDARIPLMGRSPDFFTAVTDGIAAGKDLKKQNLYNELLKTKNEQAVKDGKRQEQGKTREDKIKSATVMRDYAVRLKKLPMADRAAAFVGAKDLAIANGATEEELIGMSLDDASLDAFIQNTNTAIGAPATPGINPIANADIGVYQDPETGEAFKGVLIPDPNAEGGFRVQRVGRPEKPEQKIDANTQKLINAGYIPGTPEFQAAARKQLEGRPLVSVSTGDKQDPRTKNFADETSLRKDFNTESKPFVEQVDAYGRIQASAQDPSAAGDMSLIFNYMKVLDPGSTVREGEFANAAASGSLGERIKAGVNKVQTGGRLSDDMRRDFVDRATRLIEQAGALHQIRARQYKSLAEGYGFDPDNVVIDKNLFKSSTNDQGKKTFTTPSGINYTIED